MHSPEVMSTATAAVLSSTATYGVPYFGCSRFTCVTQPEVIRAIVLARSPHLLHGLRVQPLHHRRGDVPGAHRRRGLRHGAGQRGFRGTGKAVRVHGKWSHACDAAQSSVAFEALKGGESTRKGSGSL